MTAEKFDLLHGAGFKARLKENPIPLQAFNHRKAFEL